MRYDDNVDYDGDGCDDIDNYGDGCDYNDYNDDGGADNDGYDMMIDRYLDKQQMRCYHDSIIVSCVSYSENTFSHRLIAFLDGLSCPVDDDEA
jgi:hypothetical protein